MNAHKLARLTPLGRGVMVARLRAGEPLGQVARHLRLSTTTVRRWWRRYQAEGVAGLENRSSRPHHSPRALPRWRRRQIARCRRTPKFPHP
jgi:transposase